MRILITGAASNTGRGLIGRLAKKHELVLTELNVLPEEALFKGHEFFQCDIQAGIGLERAAVGCDLLIHLPAWHGIHLPLKTDVDYWRLNIDGTFLAFEAARQAGVKRFVYLSSQAWHGHYERYGFTKRIAEELCEYNRVNYGVSYVAVRPFAFLPWRSYAGFGNDLLYGGVDREDVLDCVVKSVEWLAKPHKESRGGHVDAVRHDPYDETMLKDWTKNPLARLEAIFPGSRELVKKYEMNIQTKPMVQRAGQGDLAATIGYKPSRHFGTFIKELRKLDAKIGRDGVLALKCPFGTR
jgi:hypothetical protein